jgi:hypothetical protein
MMLESYQRGLFQLITRGALEEETSPYLQQLVGTSRLAVVRETVHFWRAFGLERFSLLVVRYLQAIGRLDEVVEQFVNDGEFSPFLEEAGLQFLRVLTKDPDVIVAALAKTELALHHTRADPTTAVDVAWPCDPDPLLAAILREELATFPLPEAHPHRMTVSRRLPGGYVCEAAH